jgi:hypothetical protein
MGKSPLKEMKKPPGKTREQGGNLEGKHGTDQTTTLNQYPTKQTSMKINTITKPQPTKDKKQRQRTAETIRQANMKEPSVTK